MFIIMLCVNKGSIVHVLFLYCIYMYIACQLYEVISSPYVMYKINYNVCIRESTCRASPQRTEENPSGIHSIIDLPIGNLGKYYR